MKDSTLFIGNGNLIDGNGGEPIRNCSVLIQGERISKVGKDVVAPAGATKIDADGKTIMPGLIEAHFHASYMDATALNDIDINKPVQYLSIRAAKNVENALRCGYTTVVSAGSVHNIDWWLKRAINDRKIRGPRMVSCSRDLTGTGGMADWNPNYWRMGMEGLGVVVDSVDEARKAVRQLIKEGADVLKVYVDGDNLLKADTHPWGLDTPPHHVTITLAELQTICEEAHRRERMVMTHSRSDLATKMCIQAGVDTICHANYATDETIRSMKESPYLIGVVPAIYYHYAIQVYGPSCGLSKKFIEKTGYIEEYEITRKTIRRLHEAGIRIAPGGDFGFNWTPHGTYARELEMWVRQLEFAPMEVLTFATRDAAYFAKMEKDIGTIEPGKYADMLIIDGDPIANISVFQDQKRVSYVLKDGEVAAREGAAEPLYN